MNAEINFSNTNYEDVIQLFPYGLSKRTVGKSLYDDSFVSDVSPNVKDWTDRFARIQIDTKQEEMNSKGFRCDEFKNEHDGKHILFLGCSYTWGSGHIREDSYARKVFNEILKNEKVSGYFNLAAPGDSIYTQIFRAFKYFTFFGNPDVIFFNIPDLNRFYAYDDERESIVPAFFVKNDNHILNLLSYQYYLMLDQYCKSNKIKLYSTTWAYCDNTYSGEFKKSKIENFDTFYKYDNKDVRQHVKMFKEKYPEDKFLEVSRNGEHMGTAYHDYWFSLFFDKYKKDFL